MANTIKPKRSYTASATPTLAAGELAIQAADKKVFIGNSGGTGNILVASLNGADIIGTVASATSATTATSATSATTATNLAGGGAGQLPYQSASGTTAMLAAGTAGNLLQSNGTSAPSWVASPGVPTGSVFPYIASTAPTGYLLADGSAVSRTTYATLFAVIGTSYGAGNGSTTFNVPDMRGRFPLGSGTGTGLNASGTGAPSGTTQTARSLGQWGGEETNLLTTKEMPSHNHNGATQGAGSHYHTFGKPALSYVSPNGTTTVSVPSGTMHRFSDSDGVNDTDTAANHTHTIDSQGGGGRHNNVPPFVVLNFIIKT